MTAQAPVSRFPVPTLSAMPEDLRARIAQVQETAGFVPNIVRPVEPARGRRRSAARREFFAMGR